MIKKNKFLIIIFIFFLSTSLSFADKQISYLDMEYVVKNSNIGKSVFDKINKENNKNIEKLKIKDEELKNLEQNIKKKQNIISEEEFNKEIKELRVKIKIFRAEKDEMVKYINKLQKQELTILYEKINPIIQNYMEANSIEIILDVKNIIIGKASSNITEDIIKDINKKFN